MIAQLYFVLDQTEGTKKAFLEWKSTDLYSKLSLKCGGNVSYCKSVYQSIPTLPVGIGYTLTIFEANQ